VSGNSTQRDGLDRALNQLKKGAVLVVWKLDRLGHSLRHLIELIETLREKDVGFQSVSDGIGTTTAGGQLVFHIMGALAEFERSLIIERTKAGLAAAKRRGKYPGRPQSLTPQQIKHARKMLDREEETTGSIAALFDVNRTTIWRTLQKA